MARNSALSPNLLPIKDYAPRITPDWHTGVLFPTTRFILKTLQRACAGHSN
jgi:hypothetical protein